MKLINNIVYDINFALANLSWIDNVYGLAQKIYEPTESGDITYPGIYNGNNEYISMLPNDNLGNFSFMLLDDPQTYDNTVVSKHSITSKIAIIIWVNQKLVYNDISTVRSEDIKNEILNILKKPGLLKNGHIEVKKIYSKPENIYSGFNIKHIDTQYFMMPYIGLKFECEIKVFERC